jgi:chromate transporter
MNPAGESPSPRAQRLGELAALFLKLGVIGFGGPAAHIAMFEDEVVRRRGWLTHQEFLDLLGATNLIPGPNSTEMAIHVGHKRAGFAGLVVAGACFILPAMLIVMACAWAYVRFGSLPQAQGILHGVKPVIIAVILQALWRLGRTALRTPVLTCVGVMAAALSFAGLNELLLLLVGGVVCLTVHLFRNGPRRSGPFVLSAAVASDKLPLTVGTVSAGAASAATATAFGVWPMFLFFLKVGSVLFGSGYVLLAFLRADLVERWHWLTESQLLDAVAVGQITPGPLFTTATFIGYVLGGAPAALVATVGIFLPAFVFVAISGPLMPRLRASRLAGAFLDGVVVASLALMAVVTWQLGRAAIVDVETILLALASAVLIFVWRVNSAWLVLGGAVIGCVLK